MFNICEQAKVTRITITLYIIKRMYLVLLTIFSEDSFNTEVPVASNYKNTNTLDKFRFAHVYKAQACTHMYQYLYL